MSKISIITFVFMLKLSVYAQKADTTYYPSGQIKSLGVRNLESKKPANGARTLKMVK